MADTPKMVAAVAPDGTSIEIPASEAATLAQRSGGQGHVMSAAEEAKARHEIDLQKKLGGIEGYVAPGLVGAARGLTFGLSDLALASSPEMRQRLRDYEEYAPTASTGGEIAGMLGGAMLGVGSAGLVGRAGRAVEAGIVEGIGAESALGRVAAKGLGGAAAGALENAAYETGKAASDAAIHDEPLTGEKLVAATTHGALFGGAVGGVFGALGGLVGRSEHAPKSSLSEITTEESAPMAGGRVSLDANAGLGAREPSPGEALLPRGGTEYQTRSLDVPLSDIDVQPVWDQSKLPDLRAKRAAGVDLDPIRLAELDANEQARVGKRFGIVDGIHRSNVALERGEATIPASYSVEGQPFRLHDNAFDFSSPLATESPINISSLRREPLPTRVEPPAPKGSLADTLAKEADVKTIKALGGSAGDIRALEANVPGGYRRVAQDIRADVEATTGKSIGHQSRQGLHEYATKRVDELGEKLGGMLNKLDEGHTGFAPRPAEFVSQVEKQLIEPHIIQTPTGPRPLPGFEKQVEAVSSWAQNVRDAFADRAPTFGEWQKMRVALDKQVFEGVRSASPTVDALRQMRGILEGELMTAGERAAQSMGGSFQSEYQATKSLYQSVKKAQELTTRGVSRDLANNSTGLTTRLAAMAGTSVGAGLGGAVGGMLGGAAGGAIGQVVQRRGDVLAADLLSRAATLAGANRVAGRITAELDQGVKRLVSANTNHVPVAAGARAAAAPLGVKSTGTSRGDFAKVSDVLARAVANPLATADRVSRSIGPLADHSPGTANAAIQTTLRGVDFLYNKLPPSRQDQYSLQPQLQPHSRASDAEISQFMRYAQAVDDPMIVLREARTGTLTRDHVEAVQAVYPKLYDEIRGSVFRALVESKSELPYARRIQLGILLDIPTDKTLSPEFIRAVQATFSVDQAGAESPPQTGAAPDIAGSAQTATQMAVEHAA